MHVQADALYFIALETGLSYAIVNERIVYPKFKPHLGARGIIGTSLTKDCWGLELSFLHYHARVRNHIEGFILPTWGYPSNSVAEFDSWVDSMWRLHLGLADLRLKKLWPVSVCLDLTPFIGLRYAEVRTKIEIEYSSSYALSMKNKSWGIGPEVGLAALFHLWGNLSLYSRFCADLLFSKVYVHENQKGTSDSLNVLQCYCQSRPLFEMALGLDFCLACGLYGKVAGEMYLFQGKNQLFRFFDQTMQAKIVSNQGDLSMCGLSFGLGFEF